MSGIVLHSNTIKRVLTDDLFVFSQADIVDFVPIIKFPPMFDYYTGVYYLEKANTSNLRETKIALLRTAAERLANVLSYDFPHARAYFSQAVLGCYKFDKKYIGDIDVAIETFENMANTVTDDEKDVDQVQLYLDYVFSRVWKAFREEDPTKKENPVISEATITSLFNQKQKQLSALSFNLPIQIWQCLNYKQKLEALGYSFDQSINAVKLKDNTYRNQSITEILNSHGKMTVTA